MSMKRVVAALASAGVTVAAAQMGPAMMHGGHPDRGHGMGPSTTGKPGGCRMGAPGMGFAMPGGMMGGHMMGMPGGMMGGHMMGMPGGMMGGPMMGMSGGMMGGHMKGGPMMGGQEFMALDRLDLDKAQREKAREILRDSQRKMHALMGSMHELQWQDEDAAKPGEFDAAAARKRYEAHAAIQKQVFEARLDAHKRMLDVLTREQREQLVR